VKRLALCVGINAYEGSPLAGCVNDAMDWTHALTGRGYDVETLTDSEARRHTIVGRLQDRLSSVGFRGRFVFTFSGHGTWTPDADGDEADGRDEAICPVDYRNGLITDDDLYAIFRQRPLGSRVLAVLDSCHAGTATRALPYGNIVVGRTDRPRFLPPAVVAPNRLAAARAVERAPVNRISRASVPLLAAAAPDQVAWDASIRGRPRGAFTAAALDALAPSGWRPEPKDYRDWMARIRLALPSNTYPQTPQLDAGWWQRRWRPFA
jgi:hypothetical protein